MHMSCTRWGNNYDIMVQNKHYIICHYLLGKPPTDNGPDEYAIWCPIAFVGCMLVGFRVGLGQKDLKGEENLLMMSQAKK